jgi:hypothetical protein
MESAIPVSYNQDFFVNNPRNEVLPGRGDHALMPYANPTLLKDFEFLLLKDFRVCVVARL